MPKTFLYSFLLLNLPCLPPNFFFLFLLNLMASCATAHLVFSVHLSYPMHIRPNVGLKALAWCSMLNLPQPLFFNNSCQLYHIVFWSFCALGRWQQVRWSVVEPSWLSSPSQESQLVRKWEARRPGRRKGGSKGIGKNITLNYSSQWLTFRGGMFLPYPTPHLIGGLWVPTPRHPKKFSHWNN